MFARVLAGLIGLGLIGGLCGQWHPLGDSLAVFRLYLAGALAVIALWLLIKDRLAGGMALLVSLGFAGPVLWMMLPGQAAGDLRLYQKNMLFRNDDLGGLAADIRTSAADVVALQEVSEPNLILLADLKDVLPYQHYCPFAAVGGVAILTRLAPVPGRTVCTTGLAAMQVDMPGKGPVWLVSVHLHWPFPYGQAGQVDELLPVLEAMEGPVVMAGDFNMVRWSFTLARMRGAVGAEHAGPVRLTYPLFGGWTPIAIDHVLGPKGGHMELRPALGSDHRGLLAELPL